MALPAEGEALVGANNGDGGGDLYGEEAGNDKITKEQTTFGW